MVLLDKYRFLSIIRLLQAVALVVAAALVASATGYCASTTKGSVTTTVCESGQTTFSINHWSDGSSYAELQGQYFVFVCSLFFLLVSFGLFFLSFAAHDTDRRAVLTMCGCGAVFMLICGIVEAWFAAGFGQMRDDISFYVRSWVAGSVACFLAMFLYLLDVLVALKIEWYTGSWSWCNIQPLFHQHTVHRQSFPPA